MQLVVLILYQGVSLRTFPNPTRASELPTPSSRALTLKTEDQGKSRFAR